MKKLIFSVMSLALVAGTMTSCGKSSVGKMTNDWKVTSYSSSSVDNTGDGSSETGTASAVTYSQTNSGTTTTSTGVINGNTITIAKDGTWKSMKDVTSTQTATYGGVTYTAVTKKVNNTTGTWAFVGTNKTEDFKKNERVVFNMLTSTGTSSTTTTVSGSSSSTTTNSSNSDSYKTGESSMIYTITESSAKKLVLSTDGMNSHSNTSGGTTNTSSNTNKSEMTLEQ